MRLADSVRDGALPTTAFTTVDAAGRALRTVRADDQVGDGVRAGFADGTTGRFDVVVGADGRHSRGRALAFADEPHAVRPLGTTIALWTVADDPGLAADHALDHADGDRFAGIRPVPGGRGAIVYLA